MTQDDYENDAVLLCQLAEKISGWHPDALAYVAAQIEDAQKSMETIRRKFNTARAA